MIIKQKTLKQPAFIKGVGLHTGKQVQIKINPAPANTGIIFKRTDIKGSPTIQAIANNVINTERGTTIKENGASVATIEHLLAALTGMGIDNTIIDIDGPELPILDGSAKYYVDLIESAGIVELKEEKEFYYIKEKTVYTDKKNDIEIIAYPDDEFSINLLIDYNSRILGNQYAIFDKNVNFKKEIAKCRTFVFFHELEPLLKSNLIKGGDLDNAIVIMENQISQSELDRITKIFNKPKIQVKPEGILNNLDLHFPNEPARHKLLDFLGDITLIGHSVKGKFVVKKPGHKANTEFAKKIIALIKKDKLKQPAPHYDPNQEPVADINRIKQLLPHRPPFLLVDKIIYLDKERVTGVKNVTMNEPFFVGHFPDDPIMPGVLLTEAMAQTGGILVLDKLPDPENYITYLLKFESIKFKNKVIPGDTVIFDLKLKEPIRRGIVVMKGVAYVGDKIVMEGDMMAQVVKVKNI